LRITHPYPNFLVPFSQGTHRCPSSGPQNATGKRGRAPGTGAPEARYSVGQFETDRALAGGVPGYKIREGSVEHTMIGGLPALRAVGEFERNDMKITELLAWIFTVHTRTEFTARVLAEKVGDLQPVFEQILQSARIP
jgi:hypothetical protein